MPLSPKEQQELFKSISNGSIGEIDLSQIKSRRVRYATEKFLNKSKVFNSTVKIKA